MPAQVHFYILLIFSTLVLSACKEEDADGQAEAFRAELTGSSSRTWVPQFIRYQDVDSTHVDTLWYAAADSTKPQAVDTALWHTYTQDGRLMYSTEAFLHYDTLSYTLQDPDRIVLNDGAYSWDYHRILRLDADTLQVAVIRPNFGLLYTLYEITYTRLP